MTHVFHGEGQVPHLAEKPARNRGHDGCGSLDGSAVVTCAAASGTGAARAGVLESGEAIWRQDGVSIELPRARSVKRRPIFRNG